MLLKFILNYFLVEKCVVGLGFFYNVGVFGGVIVLVFGIVLVGDLVIGVGGVLFFSWGFGWILFILFFVFIVVIIVFIVINFLFWM